MRALTSVLSVLLPVAMALPASAQDAMSVEELLLKFDRQAAELREAQNNGLGRTRGINLITFDDVVVESAAPAQPEAPDTGGDSGVNITVDAAPVQITDPNKPLQAAAAGGAAPVVISQLAPELQINLQIAFGFDSAALSDEEKPKLDTMCAAMQQSSINLFRIVGHTDTSGSDEYNERLSILRAKEVARHLTEDCGIDPSRLQTIGMGERDPFNKANTRADENRRVEFQALG